MNPRLAAAKALAAVLSGKASLNSSLPTQLDKVEDRDRGFTQDLAFGTARWQPRLSALAEKLLQKPFKAADADVEALLLVGLYQLLYTRVPAHAAIGETVGCADKLKTLGQGPAQRRAAQCPARKRNDFRRAGT